MHVSYTFVLIHGLTYKWNVIKIVKLRSSDFIVGICSILVSSLSFAMGMNKSSILDMVYEHFLCSHEDFIQFCLIYENH